MKLDQVADALITRLRKGFNTSERHLQRKVWDLRSNISNRFKVQREPKNYAFVSTQSTFRR
ncbi:uncharacterized protein PHALS_07634 [Plasmopara halstedii]|uniref:Uncharacterized protein n=1 Tax=Plasmopara halstedii TaxID=4781 RepID=A0A0P1B600_PLAHL|nr:uncharacterized protein PHALS_07634 [Plasmopara halstedii]CEG49897.1 hypothetical protein PHALS_07634 [Plasmopara halstedii]|eukprot:XP_024586266.1 hypothetical protein PHALS_07634 [Plasmopara halstedii]